MRVVTTAHILADATHTIPGVVEVVDRLTGEVDDTAAVPRSGTATTH
jgi:hypothetical protein